MKHIHANMDPLGRSAGAYTPTCIALLAAIAITGSAWPIYARSECPIVDILWVALLHVGHHPCLSLVVDRLKLFRCGRVLARQQHGERNVEGLCLAERGGRVLVDGVARPLLFGGDSPRRRWWRCRNPKTLRAGLWPRSSLLGSSSRWSSS